MSGSFENTLKNAEAFLRFFLVYLVLIFCIILDIMAYGSQMIQEIKPLFTCLAVFYWSVYRPTLVPLWLAFFLGLVIDLYSGYPLGLNALGLTLLRAFITGQRRHFLGQPFINILLGFSLAVLLYYVLYWCVMGIMDGVFASAVPLLVKVLSSIVLFSPFVLIMRILHRALPSNEPVSVKQTMKPTLRR